MSRLCCSGLSSHIGMPAVHPVLSCLGRLRLLSTTVCHAQDLVSVTVPKQWHMLDTNTSAACQGSYVKVAACRPWAGGGCMHFKAAMDV